MKCIPRLACACLLSLPMLLLPACSGLTSNAPAERIYVLRPAPAPAAANPVEGVLVVPRPVVQPGLDTDRIALTRAGGELDYFAASRWGEALPKVLAAFATESLRTNGAFVTVVSGGPSPVQGDYELLLTARHFEAEYGEGGVPSAHVAFECVLVTGSPRRVVGRCDADVVEPAADNRMGPLVAALERAAQRALGAAGAAAAQLARGVQKADRPPASSSR